MSLDVIVIGAGVSGLATARELTERGLDVVVLERQVKLGGNAISERFGGYLMEHGPTTFNASVPDAVDHIDRLGLLNSAHDLGPLVKRRYLRDQGNLTGVSTSPTGFLLSGYLSPKARISILMEGFRRPKTGTEEETIHAFASRRFGQEFADKVIEPMAAGLFMGDSRQLSISGAFGRLAAMEQEHGSIIRAILKARKGSEPGRHLYSWKNGIGSIPEVLAAGLKNPVRTGINVLGLQKTPGGFGVRTSGGTLPARAVVLAVQPHVAAGMLDGLDPEAADAAGEIFAPPTNVVFLGYRREQVEHPLDGLGFLSTPDPKRIISGAQFSSSMYAGRAPAGHVAISAYAGGVRNPELAAVNEKELVAQVHRELAELLGINGMPVLHRTRRWPLGLPQYTLGHSQRVTILNETPDRVPGLFLTGNYLQGVSVASCLSCAVHTAHRIAHDLGKTNVDTFQKTG